MAYAVFATQNTQTAQLAIPLFVFLAISVFLLKMELVISAIPDFQTAQFATHLYALFVMLTISYKMELVAFVIQNLHSV